MRGLDDYYGDDDGAFAGVEELNDRIAELEDENERLRGRIQTLRDALLEELAAWDVREGRWNEAESLTRVRQVLDGDA